MEELRTTEVLEREILEDARKKAAKLLKTADDTLAQQKLTWEKKLSDDLESIRKTYMERIKKTIDDIFARLPLDKRRLRLKTHEDFLSGAINTFLANLGRERTLSILEREILRLLETAGFEGAASEAAAPNGAAPSAVVRYSGLTLSEANDILKRAPPSFDWEFQESLTPNSSPLTLLPIIVIDTDEFRLTASIEAAAAALLKDNREELAAALLGPEALND